MDRAPSAPRKVDAPTQKPIEQRTGVDAKTIAACGRGTGRRADGTCEQMRLRKRAHVQQVQVPGGRFVAGHPPNRYDGAPSVAAPKIQWAAQPPRYDETGSFWIDLYEVSRKHYADCVQAGKCTPAVCPDGGDPLAGEPPGLAPKYPQTCVTQAQAAAFCRADGLRLPTETEWEYAARGPDARPFPWGGAIRDEYHANLVPVGGMAGDKSYFGLLGMGTNAKEWTSSRFDPDAPLAAFAKGFRRPDGPLLRARGGNGGYVTKGGRPGSRFERRGAELKLGFRCAGDVDPKEAPLKVPAEPPQVPFVHAASADLQVFGAVAEAVDRTEADAFCQAASVSWKGETLDDWTVPTLVQVQSIAESFKGPGPFWTVDGAAAQQGAGQRPVPTDPWVLQALPDSAALTVRCVRASRAAG